MKTKTAVLTPLQVREAIIEWARANRLIGIYEEVTHEDVTLRENGSAVVKRVKK